MKLWTAVQRNAGDSSGHGEGQERVLYTFDTMSSNKAQTVLRYWNWALSSSLSNELQRRIRTGEMGDTSDLSTPERTASLVFGV